MTISSEKRQLLLHFALIAAFALLAMSSSFYNGITSGNDINQHYQFAVTIRNAIVSHEIYPSLSATANHGFGDFGLRFYPPFSYYVLSAIYFLTQNWFAASLIASFFVFFVGGIGTYFWAKEEFSPPQSLIAAAIFTFAPYHLNQIYNNFLFADFFATAIIPFCFFFLTRVCLKKNAIDVLGLALTYALLILTHLPQTMICSIVLGLYGLILLKKETLFSVLPKLIIAVFSALALSVFYWSRLITEINWVKHSTPQYFSDTWGYQNNFLLRIQNILNFRDDVLNLWLADLMLVAIFLLTIPSFFYLIKNRSNISRNVIAVTAIFVFAIFMTSPLSQFVWDNLSFLQKVQFPWRWMGTVSLFGSILASIGLIQLAATLKNSKNILLPIGLAIIFFVFVFTSSFIVRGAVYLPSTGFNDYVESLGEAESFDCWWVVWAKREALANKEKVTAKDRAVKIIEWKPLVREFEVADGEPINARIATFYYPHWQATVNGNKAGLEKNDDGTILLALPKEPAKVVLSFEEPFSIKITQKISLLAWILLLLAGAGCRIKQSFFSSSIFL